MCTRVCEHSHVLRDSVLRVWLQTLSGCHSYDDKNKLKWWSPSSLGQVNLLYLSFHLWWGLFSLLVRDLFLNARGLLAGVGFPFLFLFPCWHHWGFISRAIFCLSTLQGSLLYRPSHESSPLSYEKWTLPYTAVVSWYPFSIHTLKLCKRHITRIRWELEGPWSLFRPRIIQIRPILPPWDHLSSQKKAIFPPYTMLSSCIFNERKRKGEKGDFVLASLVLNRKEKKSLRQPKGRLH